MTHMKDKSQVFSFSPSVHIELALAMLPRKTLRQENLQREYPNDPVLFDVHRMLTYLYKYSTHKNVTKYLSKSPCLNYAAFTTSDLHTFNILLPRFIPFI